VHQHGKLKIMTLTERRSAKGNTYLQGVLNGLSVIAFRGETTEWGPTWDVYVSERQQKPTQGNGKPRPSQRAQDAVDLFQRPLDRR
jgi:hypothetical protein